MINHLKLNKLLAAIPFIALLCCTPKAVEVSSVSLNTSTVEMVEGDTYSLVATVLPNNAEYDGISWASSNTSVAIVNQGTVTALKEGKTTITASAGGKSATCSVTVSAKYIAVTSITLDKSELSLKVGSSDVLTATVKPDDATDKSVQWSSSDASVVKVDKGKVTALKSGTATITATAGSCSAECIITVPVETESISLDKTELSIAIGETATLTATITPADATDKTITWTSSNPDIASVENGTVKALKAGTTTITAECSGKKAECKVTVTVPVTGISLDKTELTIEVGKTATLTATITPVDATDKTITWTSSNATVATVNEGIITAIKGGTAIITAECSGQKAECKVTVTVPVSGISLDKTELTIEVGKTATLTATITPADATDKTVTWTSSNEGVVKVNDGTVKGVQAGSSTITATASGYSASCIVTVTMPDNIITYTSTDGEVVTPYNIYAFGANIISNEYNDGFGKIVFDGSVTMIGKDAYYECRTLKTINLPNTVTEIGDEAFRLCYHLESINLPELVSSIGNFAFFSTGLTQIVFPVNLKVIGKYAFSYSKLKDVILIPGLQIGECAFGGIDITEIQIPGTITYLGSCFSDCESLMTAEFEEGFEELGTGTFAHCKNLTDVKFPSTLTKFNEIFYNCFSLTNVYMKATTPPDCGYNGKIKMFFSESYNVTIWVPRSAVEAYKNDDVWGYWADKIKGYDY